MQFLRKNISFILVISLLLSLVVYVPEASANITTNTVTGLVPGNHTIKATSGPVPVLGINAVQSASETLNSVKVIVNPGTGFATSDLAAMATGNASGLALYIDGGSLEGAFDGTDTVVTLSAAPTFTQVNRVSRLAPTATALVNDAAMSITAGDIVFTNVSANPTDTAYNWHIVTTGATGVNHADLRLDSAGAAPTYVANSRFSKLTPADTSAVNGSNAVVGSAGGGINMVVGNLIFGKMTANADNANTFGWHVVTGAENITTDAAPNTLRLDSAGAAPTIQATSQISMLAPAGTATDNGATGGAGNQLTVALGDVVFVKIGSTYGWHIVTTAGDLSSDATENTAFLDGGSADPAIVASSQMSKLAAAGGTFQVVTDTITDTARTIAAGDLMFGMPTNNPVGSSVAWRLVSTGGTGVAATALRLNDSAAAPVFGYTTVLTPAAAQSVPANDTGANLGSDFYVVARTSSTAASGDIVNFGMAPGDLTYSANSPTTTPVAVTTSNLTVDTTAPTVDTNRTGPANGSTNVPVQAFINMAFNEAMDPVSLTPANITLVNVTDASAPVAGSVRPNLDSFNFIPSSAPTYDSGSRFAKLANTSHGFYQIQGTNPIVVHPPAALGGYAGPAVGDIINFQRGTFPPELGIVTNNTLTSGTFAVSNFNLMGDVQITKLASASVNAAVNTATAVTTGDIIVVNTLTNPTSNRYDWHMVTTGANINAAGLRLDGQSAAPTFVSGSSFSTITPASTGDYTINGTSNTTSPALAAGDMIMVQTGTSAPYWGLVTTAFSATAAAVNGANLANGTYKISKIATAANGLVTDTSTVLNFGDVVFAKTTANAANNGNYAFHNVTAGATGAAATGLRFDNASSNLLNGKNYLLTVTTGVTDKAGNAIAANQTLSFTTGSVSASTDTTPPFIQSSMPQPGNQAFPVNAPITLQFSQTMNTTGGASGTNSVLNPVNVGLFTSSTGSIGSPVATLNTYASATNTVTLTPNVALTPNAEYIVKVNPTAQSATGAAAPQFMLFFRTSSGADSTTPPTVVNSFPANSATGITRNLGGVTIGFNKDMRADTISSTTITISPAVTGAVSYNPGMRSAIFAPSATLAQNTAYTVTVTGGSSGVKDLAGNALAANHTFTFTSANAAADTSAPSVTQAVADNNCFAATYSKPMNTGGGQQAVDNIANYTFENPLGTQVSLAGKTVTYDGANMTARVCGLGLQNGSTFKITVASIVTDTANTVISTSGSPPGNEARGTVQSSSATGGILGPGAGGSTTGGHMGTGGTAMSPVRAYPQNRVPGATSNWRIGLMIPPTVASTGSIAGIAHGGSILLTFPTGFDVTNAAAVSAATSFTNGDLNGPATGVVTISSVTKVALARTVTVNIAVSGATGTGTVPIEFELSGIVNSTVSTATGSTLDIKLRDTAANGNAILPGGSMVSGPFFLATGTTGSFTVTANVCNDTNSNGSCDLPGEAVADNTRVFMFSPASGGRGELTASGVATFTAVASGDYMIGVDTAGISAGAAGIPQPLNVTGNTTKNFVFASASSFKTITGTVAGGAGLAATSVDIFAGSQSGGFTKTTGTLDGSGNYNYTLNVAPNNNYNVGVGPAIPNTYHVPGAPPPPPPTFTFMPPPNQNVAVAAANVSGVNFTLSAAGRTITGVVNDSAGTGISGVGVFARPVAASTTTGTGGAVGFGTGGQTLGTGAFSLNVVAGTYEVGVFKPGMPFVPPQSIFVPTSGDTVPASLTFVLAQQTGGVSISGRVLDSSGNPIPYSGVSARRVTSTASTAPVGGGAENFVGGPTDANGAFTLFVSASTVWVVEAFAPPPGPGFLGSKTVSVGTTAVTGQDFSASSLNLGTITGTATQGTARQGVMVRAEGTSGRNMGTTDASGAYRISVPAGTYTITCYFPGVGEGTPLTGVSVTSGGTTSGQNCTTGSTITLTVNLTDGTNPITNAFVDARSATGLGSGTGTSTTSGANAVYTLTLPAGTYTVRAGHPSFGPIGTTASVSTTQTITYTASAGRTYTVSGTVTAGGSALNQAWVELTGTPTGLTHIIHLGAQTNSSGAYSISAPGGTYVVRAMKPGYKSPAPTSVTVAAANVTVAAIALTAASRTISGTATLSGSPASNCFVNANNGTGGFTAAQTSATGTFTLNVDDGTWNVNVRCNGYESPVTAVTVSGSNVTGTTLTLAAISGFTVRAERTETVTPTAGGYLTNSDIGSAFKVNVPAGVLSATDSNPATVVSQANTALPSSASATVLTKSGFSMTATSSGGQPIKTLGGTVTITCPYNESDLPAGTNESSLNLGSYENGNWTSVTGAVVDTTANTITAQVDHFSDFAPIVPSSSTVTGAAAAASSSTPAASVGGGGGGGGGSVSPPPASSTPTTTTPSTPATTTPAPSSSISVPVAVGPTSSQPTAQPSGQNAASSGAHADGTLVIDGKTVFLIRGGQRVPFRDQAEYKSYGFNFSQVVPASAADKALPQGQIAKAYDGVLVLDLTDGKTIYMVAGGTKRGFSSMLVLKGLGYNPALAVKIRLADYPAGTPITSTAEAHPNGSLVSSKGTIYWILDGQMHAFPSQAVLKSYGFANNRVLKANAADLALSKGQAVKFRDGTLVKHKNNYYIISGGKKWMFKDKAAATKAGYKTGNFINADVSSYESGGTLN